MPDAALGRSQYVATDVTDLVETIWFGMETDLACEPLADGSTRFASHEDYVARFVAETAKLIEAGYLLSGEAYRAIEMASSSDVGKVEMCP